MKRVTFLFLLAALLISLFSSQLYPVDLKKDKYVRSPAIAGELAVSVNLIGEKGDVYTPGKEIRFSFQTTKDACVIVYNIDSEGYIHLLWPEDGRLVKSEGHKTYFAPDPAKDTHWETGDKTGVEYIHALAVSDPARINEDELDFLAKNDGLSGEKRFHVDMDPFLAFNSIDEELVRNADQEPPSTDYTYFYINRTVQYPRYLCSKCHSPEKLPDPYAMNCPEIIIEKVAYDQDPHYPYPPLYDVRHVNDNSKAENDSTSDRYGEKWLDENKDEGYGDSEGSPDTHVYLSLDFGNYGYPFNPYWPFYEPYFPTYYWDPLWWNYSWSGYWGDYFWWPTYHWWYRPYDNWAFNHRYPWGGGLDDWCNCRHRPILAERNVARRYIDYRRTNTELHRTRVLADSPLMRMRGENVARRLERSNIEKRVMERSADRTQLIREERSTSRNRETGRSIIYGGDRVNRASGRNASGTLRSRTTERSRSAISTRGTRSERYIERRNSRETRSGATRYGRNGSGRSVIEKRAPAGRSSGSDRGNSPRSGSSGSSTRERSKSSSQSDSNGGRRVSVFSAGSGQTYYSAPQRSASRSFGSASAPSRNASPSSTGRSRSR